MVVDDGDAAGSAVGGCGGGATTIRRTTPGTECPLARTFLLLVLLLRRRRVSFRTFEEVIPLSSTITPPSGDGDNEGDAAATSSSRSATSSLLVVAKYRTNSMSRVPSTLSHRMACSYDVTRRPLTLWMESPVWILFCWEATPWGTTLCTTTQARDDGEPGSNCNPIGPGANAT